MFIQSVRLHNNATGERIREIKFHMGVNLVVDDELSCTHNKVGKTTFLKIVDVLMGASNKDRIYKDSETKSVNQDLKDYIDSQKVSAEMSLVDKLDSPSHQTVELKVDLFNRGHYYIDGKTLKLDAYKKELNIFLFSNKEDVPTFRQLISSFIRVSVSGDDNSFLKTLTTATTTATYRAVYNFLFRISDPKNDLNFGNLKSKLKSTKAAKSEYQGLIEGSGVPEQEQILNALNTRCTKLEFQLNNMLDAQEFAKNRELINDVRQQYAVFADNISEIEYRLKRNEEALAKVLEVTENNVDTSLSKSFFDEISGILPEMTKTFDDLLLFNERLQQNKVSYLRNIEEQLLKDLESINSQKNDFLNENKRYTSLLADGKIEEYNSISQEIYQIKQEIGKRTEIISTLAEFNSQITTLEEQLGTQESNASSSEYLSVMKAFNEYFGSYANRINRERPMLVYSPDDNSFPVRIEELSGTSTGTLKSLIASYDLAYQKFAADNNIAAPHFILHDVLENIEGDDFKEIVSLANDSNCQYIVAVLREKLNSSGIASDEQDNMQILSLSSADKLFKDANNQGSLLLSDATEEIRKKSSYRDVQVA